MTCLFQTQRVSSHVPVKRLWTLYLDAESLSCADIQSQIFQQLRIYKYFQFSSFSVTKNTKTKKTTAMLKNSKMFVL